MRLGIVLTGDYGWAGGVYYSLNIIKLLSEISSSNKLTVVVILNAATPAEVVKELPVKNVELSYLDEKPFLHKLYYRFFGNRFVADINALKLDVLYPMIAYEPAHKLLNCNVYYWIYDLQHKFLPELFSEEELKQRDATFQNIASFAKNIIFSSNDSKSHFEKFYPNSTATKLVYNFISLLETEDTAPETQAEIPDRYFIVCNQFWPHKNHSVVLKALDLLIKEKKQVHIVFTGRYTDKRNAVYVNELKNFIRQHHLSRHITLTGFISRQQQVKLIANALAIIQPSFFEGWSTVVEDAKALNKFLIASNIAVNQEQVKTNVLFFDPKNATQLASLMQSRYENNTTLEAVDYFKNIERSKHDLIQIFKIP